MKTLDRSCWTQSPKLNQLNTPTHLDALGVKLTTLSKEQAEYIGVHVDGPYKPDTYRY